MDDTVVAVLERMRENAMRIVRWEGQASEEEVLGLALSILKLADMIGVQK